MKVILKTVLVAGLTMLLGAGVCGCGSSEQKAADEKKDAKAKTAIAQPKSAEELANAVGKAMIEGATKEEIDALFAKDAKGVEKLREDLESGKGKSAFEEKFGKGKKVEYGGGEIKADERKFGKGTFDIQVGIKVDGKFYTGPDFYGKEVDGVWKIVGM